MRQKKINEIKELKKTQRSQKEAEKFQDRYKKIKFFEKKKVIRNLNRIKSQLSESKDKQDPQEQEQLEKEKNRTSNDRKQI